MTDQLTVKCPTCDHPVEAGLHPGTAYVTTVAAETLRLHHACDLRALYAALAVAAQMLFPLYKD